MKLEEAIKQQVDAGRFYTNDQVLDAWSEGTPTEVILNMVDNGSDMFHVVEINHDWRGARVGNNAWCDKYVFAACVDGEYHTEEYFIRLLSLKAFW